MNKEQQLKYDQALIVSLSDEYNRVKEIADALRNDINSLDFEERMPDSQERYLLVEKLKTTEGYQTNLHNRIRFYRHRIQVNKPQPWEVDEAIRQQDVQNRPVCGDAIDTKVESHHCGLDADMDDACCQVKGVKPAITGESLRNLMGMQVVRIDVPCDVCAMNTNDCVKVELVGGYYICLAPLPNSIVTE